MKYNELNEKKQHGSPDFPIQYYRVDRTHPQYIMALHWHKEFEILHIISGEFKLYIKNIEYTLSAGDMAFIGCGLLHRGEPDNCVYECVVFDPNMLRRRSGDKISPMILPIISGNYSVNALLQKDDTLLYSTIISLFNAMRDKKQFYEFSVYGLLFRMFEILYSEDLIESIPHNKRSGHQTEIMANLIDYIETHYTEHISLKQLSSLSGMNEKYLCRLFREFTNHTPIDYINSLRIEGACHEITVNRKTVTEAAFDSGFNDLSYFCRTFKKHKGTTPKQFATQSAVN